MQSSFFVQYSVLLLYVQYMRLSMIYTKADQKERQLKTQLPLSDMLLSKILSDCIIPFLRLFHSVICHMCGISSLFYFELCYTI
jgi:hypothetical protein